jgi:hypothetical protein
MLRANEVMEIFGEIFELFLFLLFIFNQFAL